MQPTYFHNRLIIVLIAAALSSCYYDNEEELYQFVEPQTCDTTAVSYANAIEPILATRCTKCHAGSSPSGNINLEIFEGVSQVASDGRLVGAISHAEGFSAMPKGEGKLPACDIEKITAWVNQGASQN